MKLKSSVAFEFSGMPKSGKTTIIEIVSQYFRRQNIEVKVHRDSGTYASIGKENIGALNIYLACEAISFLVEGKYGKNQIKALQLIDRGIFDRCVFSETLFRLGNIEKKERDEVINFMKMEKIAKIPSRIFSFVTNAEISLRRETENSLLSTTGRVMNEKFLDTFRESSLYIAKNLKNYFNNVETIDTSLLDGRVKETARQIVTSIEHDLLNFEKCDFFHDLDLAKKKNVYVRRDIGSKIISPYVIKIADKNYFRYMDYFYIDKKPFSLSAKEIISLCDLRIDFYDSVVDKNLNNFVITEMLNFATGSLSTDSIKILDFGCGPGASMETIRNRQVNFKLFGIDPSKKAVALAKKSGFNAEIFSKNKPLPFSEIEFDLVISCFVMHFNIPQSDLRALRNAVKNDTMFVFNLYNENIDAISNVLQSSGWSRPCQIYTNNLPGNHRIYFCRAT